MNWLPVDVVSRDKTFEIEWMYFGRKRLREPFFRQTVSRLRALIPPAPTRTTGVEELLVLEEQIPPCGFIFHISRCGSTLLANCLKTVPGTTVVSEAQPVGAFFTHTIPFANGTPMTLAPVREQLLRGVLRAFGQLRRGDERALFIKFTSWQVLSVSTIDRLWPDVPRVYVIRSPVEVVVSCLQRPPGWLRFKRAPALGRRLFGWSERTISEMTDEQFYSRAVGRFLSAAAANLGRNHRIVDYEDLDESGILSIANFLQLDTSAVDLDALQSCLRTYSKDCFPVRPFRDDRPKKRLVATQGVRHACDQWAQDPYTFLKNCAQH